MKNIIKIYICLFFIYSTLYAQGKVKLNKLFADMGKVKGQAVTNNEKAARQLFLNKVSTNQFAFYYFYSPDCHECNIIKNDFFHELERQFNIDLNPIIMNILDAKNFEALLKVKTYFQKKDDYFPVIVFHNQYFSGYKEIYNNFPQILKGLISANKKASLLNLNKLKVKKKMLSLSFLAVLSAGIIDGINPCAFATIVFLISYLSYMKKNRKIILLTGIFYTSAVFSTYLLIGLGLFRGITAIPVFFKISVFVNLTIALFTFFLAGLSLKDYFLARKGRYKDMVLQLPDSFKKHIHKNIRLRTKGNLIILSALILGFTVSLFELACTGQIYFPTIIYLTRMEFLKGIVYLVIYNIMFVMPLIVIFSFYFYGISSEAVSKLFTKNIPLIKLLTFVLFLFLGVLLLLSRIL